MGRNGGASGGNRWQGYSHQELYDMLHSGPGSGAAGAIADRWSGMAGALSDIQQEINAGVTKSGAAWIGTAGDAARNSLGPLGEWAQQAATAADVMRISTELQGDLLAKARADMPAPVAVPQQPGQIGQLVTAQVDYEVAEMSSQLAAQQAAQVMAQYEAATNDNTSTLGDFGEPPALIVDTTPITGPVVRTSVRVPDQVRSTTVGRGSSASGSAVEEPTGSRGTSSTERAPITAEAPETRGSVGVSTDGPGESTGTTGESTRPAGVSTTPASESTTGARVSTSGAGVSTGGAAGSTTPATATPSAAARSAATAGVTEAGSTTTSSAAPASAAPAQAVAPAANRDRRTSTDGAGPTVGPQSGGTRYAGGAMVPAARRPDQEDDADDLVHESKYLIEAEDIY
ncbi:MAG TPA: PPE domain-containing protein, partial [Mycobacteriales bacterium]|nr:PPE domain-containing protein [Mycobacteriales bacterium]